MGALASESDTAGFECRFEKMRVPILSVIPLHSEMQTYAVRPRSDKRCFDLISNVQPFGRLWYGEPNAVSNAIRLRQSIAAAHMMPFCDYHPARNMPRCSYWCSYFADARFGTWLLLVPVISSG